MQPGMATVREVSPMIDAHQAKVGAGVTVGIRVAQGRGDDLRDFLALCELWADEFIGGDHAFSDDKAGTMFMFLLESGCVLVARDGQQAIGFIVGMAVERWFSSELVVMPFAAYVLPQYRRSAAADKLLWEFQAWARRKGAACVEIIMLGRGFVEAFTGAIERAGFGRIGQAYSWRPGVASNAETSRH